MGRQDNPPPYTSASAEASTEITPLMGSSRRKNSGHSALSRSIWYIVSSFVLCLVTFIVVNVYVAAPQAEEYVNEAAEFQVEKVSLMGVSNNGVKLKVKGTNAINYSSVNSTYFANFFAIGGYLMDSLTVDIDEVDLAIFEYHSRDFFNLGTLKIEPFTISTHNGSLTDLELIVELKPNTGELLKMAEKIFKNPETIFRLEGITYISLNTGFLPLGRFPFNFNHVVPKFSSLPNDFNIDHVTVSDMGGGVLVEMSSTSKNPLKGKPVDFTLPPVQWELFVNDCSGHPTILVASGKSSELRVSPDEDLTIGIEAMVDTIPLELTRDCDDNNEKTPLDQIIQDLMSNTDVSVLAKISALDGLISGLEIPITHSIPYNAGSLMENVTLSDSHFSIARGFDKPSVSGKVISVVKLPPGIDITVNVTGVRGRANLFYEEEYFGYVLLEDWVESTTSSLADAENKYLEVSSQVTDAPIIVENSSVVSDMLEEMFLLGGAAIDIEGVFDAKVATILGELTVDGLTGKGSTVIG